jgi:transcription elongation GreA/GreB family factor
MAPGKSQVIQAIRARLSLSLEAIERMAAQARDESTSGESKAEGQYDTRATEASYLARGQAMRIGELRQLVAWFEALSTAPILDMVSVGALVGIEGDQAELLFIAPAGGSDVDVHGQRVRVISPASPLGSAMATLEVGDAFEVDTPRGLRTYEVTSIC